MAAAKPSGSFKFRKNASIGANAAENDTQFLAECFVDTGDLAVLTDMNNPMRIIVGRTGVGKTALLTRLKSVQPKVIEVSPFALSLEYISNSTTLKFVNQMGVNLSLFYKLLWRQVFVVELIRKLHSITNLEAETGFFNLNRLAWSPAKRRQYDFLKNHAGTFWKDTDERVKEATQKIENTLKAVLKNIPGLSGIEMSGESKFSNEQKSEICVRGQEVVNQVKIRDLHETLDLLKIELEECVDPSDYFIVIDDLDKNWADDDLRYQLIDALIETVGEFQGKISRVKVIICLRTDLIARVLTQIKGAGYQDEKIRSLFLYLDWSENQLISLLDRRIDKLVRDSYTTAVITHKDLLPNMGKNESAIDYMIERTMMRPRDIISFFNYCISEAVDKPEFTKQMILDAEGKYSEDRHLSLIQEWSIDFPDLRSFVNLFKKMPSQFRLGEIDDQKVSDFCLKHCVAQPKVIRPLGQLALDVVNDKLTPQEFRANLASHLFMTGFLGLKTESYKRMEFAKPRSMGIPAEEISDGTLCSVHKMYWRALGISPKRVG